MAERLDERQRFELEDPHNRGMRQQLATVLVTLQRATGWEPTVIADRVLDKPLVGVTHLLGTLKWRAEVDLLEAAEGGQFAHVVSNRRRLRVAGAESFGRALRSYALASELTPAELYDVIVSEPRLGDDPELVAVACRAAGLHDDTDSDDAVAAIG